MKKQYFVSSFKGKSKKTGDPFQKLTIAEVVDGEKFRVSDFFIPSDYPTEGMFFGDEIFVKFEESEFMNGRPSFVSLSLVQDSPYKKT